MHADRDHPRSMMVATGGEQQSPQIRPPQFKCNTFIEAAVAEVVALGITLSLHSVNMVNRQKDGLAGRQTDRQTDKKMDRFTDRQPSEAQRGRWGDACGELENVHLTFNCIFSGI